MSERKKIILIGMPSIGKSYWGKQIAEAYNLKFIDLDAEIEKISGLKISDMFESFGEDYFRDKEHKILKVILLQSEKAVIATGGGTPCFFNNLDLMKDSGLVVYLKADIDFIYQNLEKAGQAKRPLLSSPDSESDGIQKLHDLFEQRRGFYEKADLQIDVTEKTLSQIIKIISAEG
ncbi:MAG: shikimate kinase [Chitinophagaceae bacterium]|nr:MAG: shikimate kinase [Chitinophagaceae bacterium]